MHIISNKGVPIWGPGPLEEALTLECMPSSTDDVIQEVNHKAVTLLTTHCGSYTTTAGWHWVEQR